MFNNRNYHLVLTQPFQENIHGKDEKSSKDIEQHFICHYIFKGTENFQKVKKVSCRFNHQYKIQGLQIAKIEYLSQGGECIAILKTFWLKLFLKIVVKNIQKIIEKENKMRNIHFILKREREC